MTTRIQLPLLALHRIARVVRQAVCSEALLVGLLILAPVFAGLHNSLERHVVCSEHQRVEHAELAHSSESASSSETDEAGVQLVSERLEPDAHESCALEPSLRERSIVTAKATTSVALPTRCPQLEKLRANSGYVQVSLLRLAPKQSPPV